MYSLNKNKGSKYTFLSTQSAQSTCLVLIALLKEKDRDRKTICYFCIACIRVPEGRGKEGDTCETSKLQRNEQIEREGEEREEVKPYVQSRCFRELSVGNFQSELENSLKHGTGVSHHSPKYPKINLKQQVERKDCWQKGSIFNPKFSSLFSFTIISAISAIVCFRPQKILYF